MLLENWWTPRPIAEVWFDGAKGEDARDMTYDFDAWWALVRQLQPGAVIFSDASPDVRWIGNEHGFAGQTNWSTFDRTKVGVGMAGIEAYLNSGEAGSPDWVPGECDVSIRPGWFWHPDQEPKTLGQLLEIYYKSVGRNCVLLLNVPPTTSGRFDVRDARRLQEFKTAIDSMSKQKSKEPGPRSAGERPSGTANWIVWRKTSRQHAYGLSFTRRGARSLSRSSGCTWIRTFHEVDFGADPLCYRLIWQQAHAVRLVGQSVQHVRVRAEAE